MRGSRETGGDRLPPDREEARAWFVLLLDLLGALFATGVAYVLDSLPLPVCRRVRARRCRKMRGGDDCGYCAAKRERFSAGAFRWSRRRRASPWRSRSCPPHSTT